MDPIKAHLLRKKKNIQSPIKSSPIKNLPIKSDYRLEKIASKLIEGFGNDSHISGVGFIGNNIFVSHGSQYDQIYHAINLYDNNLNEIKKFNDLSKSTELLSYISENVDRIKSHKNLFVVSSYNPDIPLLFLNSKNLNLEYCIDVRNRGDFSINDKFVVTSEGHDLYFHRAIKREMDNLGSPYSTSIGSVSQPGIIRSIKISDDSKQVMISVDNYLTLLEVQYGDYIYGSKKSNMIFASKFSLKRDHKINDASLGINYIALAEGTNLVLLDKKNKEKYVFGHNGEIKYLDSNKHLVVTATKKGEISLYRVR